MKYLIDTQILIWSIVSPEKLTNSTLEILQNNEIFVSQISLFEIVIKQKIGKLDEFKIPINVLISQMLSDGYQILSLKNEHISNYKNIPFFTNHRDPFDRLLLSISHYEKIPIISSDLNFNLYIDFINLIQNLN